MIEIDGQAVARHARMGDEIGATVGDAVGRPPAARSERLDEKTQQPRNRTDREIGEDFVKARLDDGEAASMHHASSGEIVLLAALVVPALKRGADR